MTSMIALHQVILMILMVSERNGRLRDCEEGLQLNDPCEIVMQGYCAKPRRNTKRWKLKCKADDNECTLGTANCDVNAACTNTLGSFTCSCNSGYSGDGYNCTDDECNIGTANCDVNAACTNTAGSFTCSCNSGYSGDGQTCTDDDECSLGTANCDVNGACTNTVGSFTCSCNSGYSGDGYNCTDDDECNIGTANCDVNAACTNTAGSFTCLCNSGYSGDGQTCTDDDECNLGTFNCDANAACTNTGGSFICSCTSGYSGDGQNCTDDNECSLGTANCDVNAACTNTVGSFTCSCNSGYSGDGHNCTVSSVKPCVHGVDAEVTVGTTLYAICTCDANYFGRYCDSDLKTALKAGTRVIRGRDWTNFEQDSLGPGTITSSQSRIGGGEFVVVKWDSGDTYTYLMDTITYSMGILGKKYQLYFI